MASSKTKKSWLGWVWRHKLLSLLVLVIVAAGAYAGYSHIQTSNNKRNFQNTSKDINNLYINIIKQVGSPDNAEVKSYCSRAHQEFTKGELSCDLNTNLVYPVADQGEANILMKKIQQLIQDRAVDFRPKYISQSIKNYSVVDATYHTATDDYLSNGLSCVVGYIYDTPREINLSIKDSSKKPFEVTIGCYGPAKQQYYRMAS